MMCYFCTVFVLIFLFLLFFFFKQKTAYEMRISDWSSDVCSSDLIGSSGCARRQPIWTATATAAPKISNPLSSATLALARVLAPIKIGRASCRERVCQYV